MKQLPKMKSTTMIFLGIVLVAVLPVGLISYYYVNAMLGTSGSTVTLASTLLLIGMIGIVTFPIGAVMIYVGYTLKKQKKT